MKLAIDIVLLPPEQVIDIVLAINQHEAERGNARGQLGQNDFYPHISLAMGTIREDDFSAVTKIVHAIAITQHSLTIEFFELCYVNASDGTKSYALRVKKTKQLQTLHELLMRELAPLLSYDATEQEIFKKEGEAVVKPTYVNAYLDHSFGHYDPHLTLRCKEVEFNDLPIAFVASALAICHLGTSTTCRKILFQTLLS